jgi:hypothetical protein
MSSFCIKLVDRCLLHGLSGSSAELRHSATISGYHPSRLKGVETSQVPDDVRMADSGAQGYIAAKRLTHNVGLSNPEMLDQRGDVVGHRREAQGAVDIGGATVGLQINNNHLPIL